MAWERAPRYPPPVDRCGDKSARRPVSRVLSPGGPGGWSFIWDARYRTPRATNPGDSAETRLAHDIPWDAGPGRPYSVLLPVGFTLPPPLPGARCALTAPFHPYLRPRTPAVCFLWHFPWGRPRRPLTGTVFPWSPDFPPPARSRRRPSGRLAGLIYRVESPDAMPGRSAAVENRCGRVARGGAERRAPAFVPFPTRHGRA